MIALDKRNMLVNGIWLYINFFVLHPHRTRLFCQVLFNMCESQGVVLIGTSESNLLIMNKQH